VTDAQFAALLALAASAGGSLLAALRWAVNRITSALDRNTSASLVHAKEMSKLSTKIDTVFEWVGDHTPVHGVPVPIVDHDAGTFETQTPTRPRGVPPAPPGLSPTEYQLQRARKP
jgi:hypothetical protein